jgi:hypothetical protein
MGAILIAELEVKARKTYRQSISRQMFSIAFQSRLLTCVSLAAGAVVRRGDGGRRKEEIDKERRAARIATLNRFTRGKKNRV